MVVVGFAPRLEALALALAVGTACSGGSRSGGQSTRDAGAGAGVDSGAGGPTSGSGSGDASTSDASSGSSSGSGSPDGGGGACDGGPCNAAPAGLLNPDFTTAWNPGILADTPTGASLGADGLPVRTTACAMVAAQSGDATSAIQGALTRCAGTHQVVSLAAGTFKVSATINVPGGVVLRGAGSDASSGTVIVSSQGGGAVLSIGTTKDTVCNTFDTSAQPMLAQDATKETTSVAVADASNLHAGDLALIDETDTSEVDEGDCTSIFKRTADHGLSERVEIASVSGNAVTLTTPLHWTFTTAQGAQLRGSPRRRPSGRASRAWSSRADGQAATRGRTRGASTSPDAAYCWVKDVQVDGTTSGMPIRLAGTYRCVVRDSHVHNSYSYGFAQDNYGIVLACGSADDLVENNVARFMNKPILLNNSGGGNVIGYNYADNSWSCDGNGDDGFQEVPIDCHCAFPHMELLEGNWAPHMGATLTHGNAGYLTYFRNYASDQFAPSNPAQAQSAIVWSQPFAPQYADVTSLDFPSSDVDMTVVGNVLGSTMDSSLGLPASLGTTSTGQGGMPATTQVYTNADGSMVTVLLIDQTTVAWKSLWLHGNFDTVNKKTMWNASPLTANLPASTQALPASLYYAAKPRWWPAGTAWPWVGPDLSPKVGSLPAEQRSNAFNYETSADGSCTLDCANYCCSVGPACTL